MHKRLIASTMSLALLAAGAGVAVAASGNTPDHGPSILPATANSTTPANPFPTATPGSASPPATQSPPDTASSAPATISGGFACPAGNLKFALGPASTTPTQQTQVVDLTNEGSTACTMSGFPGVDLIGVAPGQQSYSWSLVRSSASYTAVTLPPGGSAHFDVLYLPTSSDTHISVTKMVITPPNTSTQAELTWSMNVMLQFGAPRAYITPIVSGS